MNTLTEIIDHLGVSRVAKICGISKRAIYKWRKSNTLPRTEYTGETNYSVLIAQELKKKLTISQILDLGRPRKTQD